MKKSLYRELTEMFEEPTILFPNAPAPNKESVERARKAVKKTLDQKPTIVNLKGEVRIANATGSIEIGKAYLSELIWVLRNIRVSHGIDQNMIDWLSETIRMNKERPKIYLIKFVRDSTDWPLIRAKEFVATVLQTDNLPRE